MNSRGDGPGADRRGLVERAQIVGMVLTALVTFDVSALGLSIERIAEFAISQATAWMAGGALVAGLAVGSFLAPQLEVGRQRKQIMTGLCLGAVLVLAGAATQAAMGQFWAMVGLLGLAGIGLALHPFIWSVLTTGLSESARQPVSGLLALGALMGLVGALTVFGGADRGAGQFVLGVVWPVWMVVDDLRQQKRRPPYTQAFAV